MSTFSFLLASIFFWLGKDLAWNAQVPSLWILFAIPTILISVDFVCMSYNHEVSYLMTLSLLFWAYSTSIAVRRFIYVYVQYILF